MIGVGMFIMCAIGRILSLWLGRRKSTFLAIRRPRAWKLSSKASMPAFVVLVAMATSSAVGQVVGGLLVCFYSFVSFLTGERINFIMRLWAACLQVCHGDLVGGGYS